MKTLGKIQHTALLGMFFMVVSCSDEFLDTSPAGVISDNMLVDEKGIYTVLVGAYSAIDGVAANQIDGWPGSWAIEGSVSNWIWGSVRSDDATLGSDGSICCSLPTIERYMIYSTDPYVFGKWASNYEGIARCNDVLKLIGISNLKAPEKLSEFKAEALFLRAWFHFELKRAFNNIPYITEDVNPALVTNKTDAWPMIEADLEFAVTNLPESQQEPGRANRYAAMAVLARVHLFQNEWQAAADLLDEIIESGRYTLMPNFDDNYLIAKRNNAESIFEIQYAVNDGPESFNGGWGDSYTFPSRIDNTFLCCGFHQPTQNLVNAFKTNGSGLPMLDNFNELNFKNDMGLNSEDFFVPDTIQTVDPRLDFTIGRRGIPYLDWGIMRGYDWIRDQGNGGPYLYKKNMFLKGEMGIYSTTTGWANGVNANNYRAYRYAHILLWRAECSVELGDLEYALELVNRIRHRAANHMVMGRCYSYKLLSSANQQFIVDYSKPAANYLVGEYPGFTDQAYARKAVHMELRLEFAMEGHRFYDLVRWGEAGEVLNEYIARDIEFRSLLGGAFRAVFEAGIDEYLPIPASEVKMQGSDVLIQNPGYETPVSSR